MTPDRYDRLLGFLARLDEAKIHYRLAHHREGALSVEIVVPGERWEVDFLTDGGVEIERFRSEGTIHDEAALTELFATYSDAGTAVIHNGPLPALEATDRR